MAIHYPETNGNVALSAYHIFKKLNEFFVFDTSSCRFYKIDEIAFDLLTLCQKLSIEEAEQVLATQGKYSAEQIDKVIAEVRLLAKNGLFDVPDFSMPDQQIDQALDRTYQNLVGGLEFALAESCNLACKYCYCGTSRNMPNNGLMTERIAHQAVLWLFDAADKAKSNKVSITFFGGEPLLNKPVIYSIVAYSQLLAQMRNKTVSYHMTTNGTLLDDEFVTYAKKNKINIMVSLDGPEKIHDRQCPMQNGKGSFKSAAAGAKRLLHRSSANVRCTMTHPVPDIKELIDFFEKFGFKRAILGPTINPAHSPSGVDFLREDFEALNRQEEALIPWYKEKMLKKEKIEYSPFEKFLTRIPNCSPKQDVKKCGACHSTMIVGADGSLFPCHRFGGMVEWKVGHISEPPDYAKYKKFWKEYRQSLKACEKCWAWPICKGPCPWELLQPDGSFCQQPRFCEFVKNRIESAAYLYSWMLENKLQTQSQQRQAKKDAVLQAKSRKTKQEYTK